MVPFVNRRLYRFGWHDPERRCEHRLQFCTAPEQWRLSWVGNSGKDLKAQCRDSVMLGQDQKVVGITLCQDKHSCETSITWELLRMKISLFKKNSGSTGSLV